MDKISVIIPVYKVEKYIHESIQSVINQTYKNLEIILVDDGSPDLCGKICDEYADLDKRIIVIHKKNEGVSQARNTGIDISTGKYIAFLDSDDYINLRYFEVLYNNLVEKEADISVCSYIKFDDGKKIENTVDTFEECIELNREEAMLNLYGKYRGEYVVPWGKLYKSKLFEKIRFPKDKIHEDCFINYKLYFNSDKVVYDDSKLYYYRQRDDSITGGIANKGRLDSIESIEEQIDFYKKEKMIRLQIECMKCYSLILGNCYIMFKSAKEYDICKQIKSKRKKLINTCRYMKLNRLDYDFVKAPWRYGKYVEIYWLFISIRNKFLHL